MRNDTSVIFLKTNPTCSSNSRHVLPLFIRQNPAPLAAVLPAPVSAPLGFCAALQPWQRLPYYLAGFPDSWRPEKDGDHNQIIKCHEFNGLQKTMPEIGAKLLSKQL